MGLETTARVIRSDLDPLPLRMRKLPIDERGYPVPWFVAWVDGPEGPETVPEFRAMDARKFRRAIQARVCWVCGEPLGRWLAFPIGAMCVVTRAISEPPCHLDCAEWSIKNCPFLNNPRAVRDELTDKPPTARDPAGFGIKRNPGVACLWVTREYEVFHDGRGGALITIGKPDTITWWRERRRATRAEVDEALASGLPILLNAARRDGRFAVEALEQQILAARVLLPSE
jgi:hypothetical protein